MPLYEYRCPACGKAFELLQRMGDGARDVRCPECDFAPVERRLSTFATAVGGRGRSDAGGSSCGLPQCGGGFCAGREN